MSKESFTPGPWSLWGSADPSQVITSGQGFVAQTLGRNDIANGRLIAAAPDLLEALHEGRRAIGDHFAPNDCYATGPLTGNDYRDLVECPACFFIAKYEAAIAKARGEAA